MMRWKGWLDVGEEGFVSGAKRGVRERFVSGKVGRRRSGRAWLWGDLRCRKWILKGDEVDVVAVEGSDRAVRN